jgi:hypothetical protein
VPDEQKCPRPVLLRPPPAGQPQRQTTAPQTEHGDEQQSQAEPTCVLQDEKERPLWKQPSDPRVRRAEKPRKAEGLSQRPRQLQHQGAWSELAELEPLSE